MYFVPPAPNRSRSDYLDKIRQSWHFFAFQGTIGSCEIPNGGDGAGIPPLLHDGRHRQKGVTAVIEITPEVGISEHELSFSFERSPGPGGQNVNKVNTRVTLHFDLDRSTSLSNLQKGRIRSALPNRIGSDGVLRIVSSRERTQLANRRAAVNRFIELLTEAFQQPKPRVKTRPSASSQRKRVDAKTRRGAVKRSRQTAISSDE
jgi:ribosome-associated protein